MHLRLKESHCFIHICLQGPCCTHDCQMKEGDKCRDDNGCRDSSFCNGRGPECPPSTNKPNKVTVAALLGVEGREGVKMRGRGKVEGMKSQKGWETLVLGRPHIVNCGNLAITLVLRLV